MRDMSKCNNRCMYKILTYFVQKRTNPALLVRDICPHGYGTLTFINIRGVVVEAWRKYERGLGPGHVCGGGGRAMMLRGGGGGLSDVYWHLSHLVAFVWSFEFCLVLCRASCLLYLELCVVFFLSLLYCLKCHILFLVSYQSFFFCLVLCY